MDHKLTIRVEGEIATRVDDVSIVCGNSGYEIEFQFDEAWAGYEVKTALFAVNGECLRKVFTGNICPVPVIKSARFIKVGVTAGTIEEDTLTTSISAFVECIPCAGAGTDAPLPEDDVYTQIVKLCEDAQWTEDKQAGVVADVLAALPKAREEKF